MRSFDGILKCTEKVWKFFQDKLMTIIMIEIDRKLIFFTIIDDQSMILGVITSLLFHYFNSRLDFRIISRMSKAYPGRNFLPIVPLSNSTATSASPVPIFYSAIHHEVKTRNVWHYYYNLCTTSGVCLESCIAIGHFWGCVIFLICDWPCSLKYLRV